MLIADIVGITGSFSTAYGAHTGIATLPLKYYGNKDQKNKFLTGLVSGELKGAYCLTEPNSGSDANSGKSKATLNPDKSKYIINGQKMWISNGGFADIFIPYTELPYTQANVDSDKHFLAFEKSYIVNEDETVSQDWIVQDFSDLIGLDSNSVYNSWIDFDSDNDIDVILMIPSVSDDGISINYNFKIFLNNSLF